jgi:hypothetical protein
MPVLAGVLTLQEQEHGGNGVTIGMWLLVAVGTIPGFYVGRWTAESGRARFDQKRVWDTRQNYRRTD